uniref:phycobilisome degradation protein n=1 Tax=Crassiphycus birdiae TaxID=2782747 RepID=UPI001D110463|nr:phycobilisome degradation protein [Crassiphycus birdiae]YP_010196937.1 phycobilisome degradation protein [Crassiphycus corneus]UAD83099.1 phycobilisome degradation protein [Crassiphycus birdiae]UAD84741.1 phycobilisome degradation protein [Crassiphycus corneus]
MDTKNSLTLEQEFKLTIYRQKVNKLNDKQIKKHLILTLKQMIIKDNVIKYFIKNSLS